MKGYADALVALALAIAIMAALERPFPREAFDELPRNGYLDVSERAQ